jgi:hypothetical protein
MPLVPITDHRVMTCKTSHQRQAGGGFSRVQRHILAPQNTETLSQQVLSLQGHVFSQPLLEFAIHERRSRHLVVQTICGPLTRIFRHNRHASVSVSLANTKISST